MKVLLSLVAAATVLVQTVTADSFVKASGTKFTLNNQPFYFEGSNACMYKKETNTKFFTTVYINAVSLLPLQTT